MCSAVGLSPEGYSTQPTRIGRIRWWSSTPMRAAKLWPGMAAVGQRIRMLGAEALVVGVTEPIRYGLAGRMVPADIPPTIFFMLGRVGPFGGTILIRHEGSAAAILPAILARARDADSSLQLTGLEPLGSRFDRWVAEPRFQTRLLSALAFLGLVVAALGVYGVVAYAVARRTGEIGVRLALGADRRRIVALFVRWNGRLVGTGLALGLLGSIWLTRYMRVLLFGTEPTDPLTFASMAALLALTALVATLAPMRRALAVDPALTLRAE